VPVLHQVLRARSICGAHQQVLPGDAEGEPEVTFEDLYELARKSTLHGADIEIQLRTTKPLLPHKWYSLEIESANPDEVYETEVITLVVKEEEA
jgi:hypothetical protein